MKTDNGYMCYNCYADTKIAPRKKRVLKHEEADMQAEFFRQVKILFPKLPEKLLFAVPNGGSRHKIEAANMKRQGVKAGVADVILLVPKKGYALLCTWSLNLYWAANRMSRKNFNGKQKLAGVSMLLFDRLCKGLML